MTEPDPNPSPPSPPDSGSPAPHEKPDPLAHFTFPWFFIGFFLGGALSVVIFVRGVHIVRMRDGTPLFLDPGIKILIGGVCVCFRDWRSFGAGILVSIVVGLLILAGSG